jgi:peptidoglycan/LPS O-acetylase OafA/YrhL
MLNYRVAGLRESLVTEQFFGGVHALRAAAALLVVLAHASYFATAYNGANEHWVRAFGRIGVVLFFSISGFVIALQRHQPVSTFFARRFLRIYPIYWIAIALAMALKPSVYLTFPSVLLLPWPVTNDSLVIPYWTLIFEVVFYVIAGALFCLRLNDRYLVALALVWIAAINFVDYRPNDLSASTYPGSMILLSPIMQVLPMGFICGVVYRQPSAQLKAVLLIAAGITYWASTPFVNDFIGETAIRHLFIGLSTTLVVAAAADFRLKSEALKILGDASYGIYLIHVPFMVFAVPSVAAWPTFSYFLIGAGAGLVFGLLDRALYRNLVRVLSPGDRKRAIHSTVA